MMVGCKGAHFVTDIILPCVRWSLASPLSDRQVEELMPERGVAVDKLTVRSNFEGFQKSW
jgi:putative transposase